MLWVARGIRYLEWFARESISQNLVIEAKALGSSKARIKPLPKKPHG